MARRTSRTTSSRRGAKEPRQARAKSKKPAAVVADVEVVEEAGGEGLDTALIIATTVALVLAIAFTDALLGRFDAGLIF